MNILRLILSAAALITLAGCITEPWLKPPLVDPTQTASREPGFKTPCPQGEFRSYRPSSDRKNTPYDAAIPPTTDVPSRLPSECNRERD